MPEQLGLFESPPPQFLQAPAPDLARPTLEGEHVTGSELRRRGWTATAVRRFLGRPDAAVERVRGGWSYVEHRFAAPRVRAAEVSPAFAAWMQERDARRAAARRGQERALVEAVELVSDVPRMPLAELHGLAVENYNERLLERMSRRQEWGKRPASVGSEPTFLARLSVNYLRHVRTPYDAVLRRLDRLGQPGRDAAIRVKRRVLDAVAIAYPELAAECARQLAKVGG